MPRPPPRSPPPLPAAQTALRPALRSSPWDARLEPELLLNLGRFRRYNSASARDLLRVIRNKASHFRELPPAAQASARAALAGARCAFCFRIDL